MSPLWSAKVEADVLGILQDVTNRGQTREAAWEGAMMVCVELVTATASSQRSVWTSTRGNACSLPSFDSEAEVARFMAAGATHFTAGGGRAAVPEMTAPRQPTFADGVVVVIDGLTPSARS